MKSKLLLAALCAFVLTSLAVAADVVVPAPAPGNTAENILTWLTPILVPLALAGFKKIFPKIPSGFIPWLAPVFGMLLDVINTALTTHPGNLWLGAGLGAIGVAVREMKDAIPTLKAPNGGWPIPNP